MVRLASILQRIRISCVLLGVHIMAEGLVRHIAQDSQVLARNVRSWSDYENQSHELAKLKRYMAEHHPENMYDERAWEVAERMPVIA